MQRAIERPSDFSAQMKATTLSAHAEKFGLSAETRLQLAYHVGGFKMLLFFPSNASWLSPGRSTRSIACCIEQVN
jgi:hypothetical protein